MAKIVICITRLKNAILQAQARFAGQRRQPGPTSGSTCKTFSSRVIHKHFSVNNLFKAKYNQNYQIGNLFFFHWQHKGYKKRLSRQKSTNSSNIQNRRRRFCYS
jgi:hypothetical protein